MADRGPYSGEGLLQGRAAAILFGVFACCFFFSALVRAITATIAPALVRDLGVGSGALGLLTGALFIGYAITQLPLGNWLDRYGPRRVLACLLVLAVAGCLTFASAQGLAGLALARVLMGVGLGACLTAPLIAFRLWFSPMAQLRANSWILMSGALGSVASTLPVQLLLPLIGWRGVFFALAAVFSVMICAIVGFLPRGRARARSGAAWGSAGGYGAVWRHPTFRAYAGIASINYAGMMAMQTLWIGPWLVNVAGQTGEQTATGLFYVNACMLAAFCAWGFAMPRLVQAGWTSERLVAWGTPLTVMALVAIALAGPAAQAGMWAIYCLCCTFMAPAQPLVGRAFPEALAGRALSAYNLLLLSGVFVIQWCVGMAIDLFNWAGAGSVDAFRGAVGFYALVALASYLLHLRAYRRTLMTLHRMNAAIPAETP